MPSHYLPTVRQVVAKKIKILRGCLRIKQTVWFKLVGACLPLVILRGCLRIKQTVWYKLVGACLPLVRTKNIIGIGFEIPH
jgi:hypothetical protein